MTSRRAVVAILASPSHSMTADLARWLATVPASTAKFVVANDMDTISRGGWSLSSLEAASSKGDVSLLQLAGGEGVLNELTGVATAMHIAPNLPILPELMAAAPKLEWVHSFSAGVDQIVPRFIAGRAQMTEEQAKTLVLTNTKGAFSRSLAEYALMSMLHFNKRVTTIQANSQDKVWEKFEMPELFGKTVAFLGFGDIAQHTARLSKAFGMKVIGIKRRGPFGDHTTLPASLLELADSLVDSCDVDARHAALAEADFVVCTLPSTPTTDKSVSTPDFRAMKRSSVFVSLGRGVVIDQDALTAALKPNEQGEQLIAGAALDVFAVEPLPEDSGLWGLPHVLITAHNADMTPTFLADAYDVFWRNLTAWTTGSPLATPVDLDAGY